MFCADGVSGSWKNPQQLKMFNNCPILLCSSSHSSPALLVSSSNNAETQRRRSNSEGCGPDLTVRKSWSVIGESTSCSLIPSSDPGPLDYSAESWSSSVDPQFLASLDRRAVRRQEVIYELMQTEFHHLQTLRVMADVLRRGLQEEVQLEEDVIGQIFPSLDDLVTLHSNFLAAMETRRWGTRVAGNHWNYKNQKNYIVQRIGDVLLQQFGGAVGEQVMELYGDFCSKHSEALRVYKHLQQNNRKLQLFIRQQSSNSLIKRREIPEFLLLVTQRITKYPVLLERLLQHTDGGGVEQGDTAAALEALRVVLGGVERRVSDAQHAQKLHDILTRLDPKSFTRLKSGEIYTKHSLTHTSHSLTHSATLTCRTTSGRLRDVLALLFTDVLVFLQEKEQKLTFAALEQKPAVVPLKGLIWREIANQERGLFLISSDWSAGPEMYEIHTHSREERNTWITLLQHSTHRLMDGVDELKSNEEKKAKKIQKLQEAVWSLDLQVCAALEEKLFFCTTGLSLTPSHLLLHHDSLPTLPNTLHTLPNSPQGFTLLQDAQRHVVGLMVTLVPWGSPESVQDVEGLSMPSLNRKCPGRLAEAVLGAAGRPVQIHLQVMESIQRLVQILYSLQAVVIIQDSLFEVQKLLLLEDEALPPWPFTDWVDVKKASADWSRLEEREREQEMEMGRIQREEAELEAELRELEGRVQTLREEQRRVEEERERLAKTLNNNNNNSNNYNSDYITPPTTDRPTGSVLSGLVC
ncbi:rho guanine nucleotide exchange factor 28 [Astyanax mexicanus]|uniref:rho guanine nucleotide exchange factor 28 n=1 Tax=Astyanax mexicanus TaxID=7994 RepID=UPI0020CB07F5|nr:rho guanine nucleotide exchange factor 28 [Astyanax mexicanus]